MSSILSFSDCVLKVLDSNDFFPITVATTESTCRLNICISNLAKFGNSVNVDFYGTPARLSVEDYVLSLSIKGVTDPIEATDSDIGVLPPDVIRSLNLPEVFRGKLMGILLTPSVQA